MRLEKGSIYEQSAQDAQRSMSLFHRFIILHARKSHNADGDMRHRNKNKGKTIRAVASGVNCLWQCVID